MRALSTGREPSAWDKSHGETCRPVCPEHRHLLPGKARFKLNLGESLDRDFEHNPGLKPREGCAGANMRSSAEGRMAFRLRAIQPKLVRYFVEILVSIRGCDTKEDPLSLPHSVPREDRVPTDRTNEIDHDGIESEAFLDGDGNQLWLFAKGSE